MADHSEVILDAFLAAMAAISTGSGDSFTPQVVQRWGRYQSQMGPVPNIQVDRGEYSLDREDVGGNWRADLIVDIELQIEPDEDVAGEPTSKTENVAYSDVVNAAINMDWETLKANLARVESTPFRREDPDEPSDGMVITFLVEYRLAFDDLSLVVDPS